MHSFYYFFFYCKLKLSRFFKILIASQNSRNCISEDLNFELPRASMAPDPPRYLCIQRSFVQTLSFNPCIHPEPEPFYSHVKLRSPRVMGSCAPPVHREPSYQIRVIVSQGRHFLVPRGQAHVRSGTDTAILNGRSGTK